MRAPRLTVSVCDWRGLPVRAPGLARWLSGIAPAQARGELTLVLIGDTRMRALNRDYRGKDYATDVLSFPNDEPDTDLPPAAGGRAASARAFTMASAPTGTTARHLGDVVIATGVAARQAKAARHALGTELRVLALHGLLHLLGYDHEEDGGEMARVERRLRRRGGLREGLIERAV